MRSPTTSRIRVGSGHFWGWCILGVPVRAHMISLTVLYTCIRFTTGVNVVVILYLLCAHRITAGDTVTKLCWTEGDGRKLL